MDALRLAVGGTEALAAILLEFYDGSDWSGFDQLLAPDRALRRDGMLAPGAAVELRRDRSRADGDRSVERAGGQPDGCTRHSAEGGTPGKSTLVEQLQRKAAATDPGAGPAALHEIADQGLRGSPQGLPHLDAIQRSFGRHEVGGIRAFVGGPAAAASHDMGAEA
jgi:hypothetical protein